MRSPRIPASVRFSITMMVLLCVPLITSAQVPLSQANLLAPVPPGAVAPLGTLATDPALFDINSESSGVRVDTANAGLTVRVAPGELLPISIKLLNFGGGKRVDVLLTYGIFSPEGTEIYATSETVAVETTASFVKTVQVPFDTVPGTYNAKTSITYQGQVVPATTQFPFTVEKKFLGFFQSDFIFYGMSVVIVCILTMLMGWAWARRRRSARATPFDYSKIPRDVRTFYEIVSDTIMQMRGRVGDDALEIASRIDGLKIDRETGRVLSISDHPSKVIATLVSEYEKLLGKKVSFSFRK